jgi:large subunit ribosomal protein L10
LPSERILAKKIAKVDELADKLKNAQSIVLVDYRGLTVEQDTVLRRELRESGVEYRVIKNSIISHALKKCDSAELEKYLEGPTAIAFSDTDPIAPSKIIVKYAKNFGKMDIKGGMVEGNFLDEKGVREFASIPSREELIAKLMGSLQSPLYGLAIALNAIAEKQEQTA